MKHGKKWQENKEEIKAWGERSFRKNAKNHKPKKSVLYPHLASRNKKNQLTFNFSESGKMKFPRKAYDIKAGEVR